jgi:uncharacterized protein with GYD domain
LAEIAGIMRAAGGTRMPFYITQGRYTREAIKGMIVRPEDRADAVGRVIAKAGGKLMRITSRSANTI